MQGLRDLPFDRQIEIASPYSGEAGYDRYDVYRLRDIMYATYANEYLA